MEAQMQCIGVHQAQMVCIGVHQAQMVCIGVHWCALVCVGVRWCARKPSSPIACTTPFFRTSTLEDLRLSRSDRDDAPQTLPPLRAQAASAPGQVQRLIQLLKEVVTHPVRLPPLGVQVGRSRRQAESCAVEQPCLT
jgi:hypothetical protein